MKPSTPVFFFILLFMAAFPAEDTLPDFTLQQLDGTYFSVHDLKGEKVILIDFWATWCKPCIKLLKKLDGIQDKYPQDLAVLAVTIDDASAQAQVENYVKGKGFRFTVLLDPERTLGRMLNPSLTLPFTVLIDKKGAIVYTHAGYIPGYEIHLESEIQKLINR